MSCQAEEAVARAAQDELDRAQLECAGLDPNSGEWLECMRKEILARVQLDRALDALRQCRTATRLLVVEGYVTFLRVHELNSGFGGGSTNFLDAEAIFKLDSAPEKAFGFQVRENKHLPAREGMLSLLQNAMTHDMRVRADYLELVSSPHQNSTVIRVTALKPRPPRPLTPADAGGAIHVDPA